MKTIALALLLISMMSCGDNNDDEGLRMDQEETTGKNLFSRWIRSDNRSFLDFTGSDFDQPRSILLSSETGENCSCTILIRGSQNSGTLDIFSCSEPGCDELWENGRRPYEYTKGQLNLEVCEAPGICGTFR